MLKTNLKKERRQINIINFFLIKLLHRRLLIVKKIGLKKQKTGQEIFDKNREKEIKNHLLKEIPDQENIEYYQEIFDIILKSSREVQKNLKKGRA
ncbi:chorismate mutase [Oenococcus oeni]|uniref:Chorismate mutase n=8 Tax=Oenococcus oeni TaxID=1247 RepID=Q04HC9_OENOB|nr:chorismate mutase [Oenococcus oeni]EAV39126.1 chorismate mutase [Oenococcus oeni ATCC BAA-1163]KGO17103.1 chorismate mutase [Oenococcus oeni X2L]ABJ56143.1 chorismate mutase [Oenococcus oeni PSU-1]AVI93462.1 chorismate mutase [Oenococcus oeni]AWW98653.1 chorismate mutase [Oenococcus oeni]